MTIPIPTPAPGASVTALSPTLLPAVLRTTVPLIVALLVRKGVVEWLGITEALANSAIAVVVTLLFYVAVRLAERHKAAVGWLLGYAQQPVYVKGEVLTATEVATPPTTTTVIETDVEPDGGTPDESPIYDGDSDDPNEGSDSPAYGSEPGQPIDYDTPNPHADGMTPLVDPTDESSPDPDFGGKP